MLKRVFFTLLMLLAIVSSSNSSRANDSDVDIDDNVLIIETDESHDLVIVGVNPDDPDEVLIQIFQFDDPFSLNDFNSIEEAIDAADDFRDEDRDFDNFDSIEIRTFGGNDLVYVYGNISRPCLIVGGDGDDELHGGSGDDEIHGDSDSAWDPDSGEDVLRGNSGEDELHGGPQDDKLYGGLDDDDLFGDGGNDDLFGSSGEDVMFGGAGLDFMDGGGDDDTMHGGTNNDEMYGGSGDDVMNGNSGNDDLFGESGLDTLNGGADADYLDGSHDGLADIMIGGAHADEFVNRYFEIRTGYFAYPVTYRIPRVVFDGWRIRIVYETYTQWVFESYTYQWTLEFEQLEDYDSNQGDVLVPVQLN